MSALPNIISFARLVYEAQTYFIIGKLLIRLPKLLSCTPKLPIKPQRHGKINLIGQLHLSEVHS